MRAFRHSHPVGLTQVLPALVLLVGGCTGQSAEEDLLHVILLHTNDVHGQVLPQPATWTGEPDPPLVGGLPRVASAIRTVRRQAEESGALVVLLDGGDWSQGTPEGRIDGGRAAMRLLQQLDYDAMAVGNHEFDRGVQAFEANLEQVPLPALIANARHPGGQPLGGTQNHLLVERDGLKIAIVGLLTTMTPKLTHGSTNELEWLSPATALLQIQEQVGSVDLLIPLTHMGLEEDRALARALPDLELIVGGHSHSFLPEGEREGDVLIAQAGSKACYLGRVDLWLDPSTRQVRRKQAQLLPLPDLGIERDRDLEFEQACADLTAESSLRMAVEVGELTRDAGRGRDRLVSTAAGNLVTDMMRAHTGADLAVHNRGGLRTDLPAGRITRRQIFQLLPFENHLVTLELTGEEVLELLDLSVSGRSYTALDLSGGRVAVSDEGGESRVKGMSLDGVPLDPAETYTLTTNSFLATGGDGFPSLKNAEARTVDPILLSELFEEALQAGPVSPSAENRFVQE